MASTLVYTDDPKQALRISRFFMSVSMYVLSAIPVAFCAAVGLIPLWVAWVWGGLAVCVSTTFYTLFRLGINKRASDPSLTFAQIGVAIPLIMFCVIYGGAVRGAFLVTAFIALVFGCYKLARKQLVWLSVFAVAILTMAMPLIARVDGPSFNLPLEVAHYLVFATFLPFLSVLAGSISAMRRQLAEKNVQLAQALHTISEMATHDELTGLYNRRYIMEVLRHEKNRTDRGGGGFCVCILDIDHFKLINDTYGHSIGDEVLKTFASQTQSLLRSTDFFGRWGGEEFILMQPNTSLELGSICTERIRELLEHTHFPELGPDYVVTVSIGLVQYYLPESLNTTLERADHALYRAKRGGRNRTEVSVPTLV
ncbi:diguanylate cyclase [Chitinivorax sp. PXF-14]|uniref:GGDEF domain-containing protein n=1 Tax=Chitinivorax sp. PXF-14 TaxID=3230488 RepID=UPI003464FBC4